MWTELLTAIALVLILEGIMPFLSPGGVRRALLMFAEMSEGSLRVMGLTLMVLGVVLLTVVRL